jgi:hypothetical protein
MVASGLPRLREEGEMSDTVWWRGYADVQAAVRGSRLDGRIVALLYWDTGGLVVGENDEPLGMLGGWRLVFTDEPLVLLEVESIPLPLEARHEQVAEAWDGAKDAALEMIAARQEGS